LPGTVWVAKIQVAATATTIAHHFIPMKKKSFLLRSSTRSPVSSSSNVREWSLDRAIDDPDHDARDQQG
jgi:hypothetical protein